ncbi:MAG: excalibur calcium-binding domain-containing protein [Solirubrobacterales bacterium]
MEIQIARLRLAGAVLTAALLALAIAAQPAAAFRDRDCADFSTQAQAQRFFKRHHPRLDPHRLDADHDGLACEDLP